MKTRILQSCLLGAALVLGGCASGLTGDTYSREEARAPQTVRMGTVESVRLVQIEGTKTNIGTGAGAVVGGVYEDTPAADLGLSEGDTITAVDGIAVGSTSELSGLIAEYTPGTEVTITWTTSSGAEQSGTTTLIAGPAD